MCSYFQISWNVDSGRVTLYDKDFRGAYVNYCKLRHCLNFKKSQILIIVVVWNSKVLKRLNKNEVETYIDWGHNRT